MPKEPDQLHQAQYALLDLLEDLGTAAVQLREALADFNQGNQQGAEIVAEDAVLTLSNIEQKASETAAQISRWIAA